LGTSDLSLHRLTIGTIHNQGYHRSRTKNTDG